MTKLRVLIAEDHEIVRRGLRLLVDGEPDFEVVGEAGDGREAARLAAELRPDVAVMDVSMPKANGVEATGEISRTCPRVKVLALTRHADESFLRRLFAAGASGYLLKQSAPEELVRAVRAVAGGGTYLDPSLTAFALQQLVPARAGESGAAERPTAREVEVLRLSARGLANKEVAARLDVSVKTVEVHKANGMRKLGLRDRQELLRHALAEGWLADL